MRISILTQDDGIFSYDFVHPFIEELKLKDDVSICSIGLSYSSANGKNESTLARIKAVYSTFGSKFLFFSLFSFVKNKLRCHSVKSLAARNNLKIVSFEGGVNSHSYANHLRTENVDVVVIIAGTEIIRSDTLAVPSLGFINCHSSLLPNAKGVMPVFWTMLQGFGTGFTWYKLDAGIDSGTILIQKKLDVQERSFVQQLTFTKNEAAKSVVEALNRLKHNNYSNEEEFFPKSYNKFPERKDVINFRLKNRLV